MTEFLVFALVAVVLYFVADRIIDQIETAVGRRLEYRTLYFFALLLGLALGAFWLIRIFTGAA